MTKKTYNNYKKGDDKVETKQKNWKSNFGKQIGSSGSKGAPLQLATTFQLSYFELYFRPLVLLGHYPGFMWPEGFNINSDLAGFTKLYFIPQSHEKVLTKFENNYLSKIEIQFFPSQTAPCCFKVTRFS